LDLILFVIAGDMTRLLEQEGRSFNFRLFYKPIFAGFNKELIFILAIALQSMKHYRVKYES
jgi:hypothetical protein